VSVAVGARQPSRPALRRRTDHRLVAGVAGGIADWLNAPVGFVRIVLLVASVFADWWLIAAYGLAALVLPARGRRGPDWDNLVGLGRLGVLLIAPRLVLGQAMSINELFEQPPDTWVPLLGLVVVGGALLFGANYPRASLRSEEEERAAVLAAAPLAVFAGVLALGLLLVPDVRWDRLAPLAVIVTAAALLVGIGRGSWRFYIAPAVVATLIGCGLAAADVRLQGGIGDRLMAATASGQLPDSPRVAIGDLSVDLSRVSPASEPRTYRMSVGSGRLDVILPRRGRVAIDARVGRGVIYAIPHRVAGFNRRVVDSDPRLGPRPNPKGASRPVSLRVLAEVGLGEIQIYRIGTR
jgi:phage shock protein PspC (stress-responsive transcriptional regulator)